MAAVETPTMCSDRRPTASQTETAPSAGITVGTLVGFSNHGRTPLVTYPGQSGSAALVAGAVVDLHASHIGRSVALMFEGADRARPIVIGWLREAHSDLGLDAPQSVDVDADGERLIVNAKEQLVLRCGSASITLTKAGKVIIRGAHIVSHSSGVNRVKGGVVHLN